MHVNYVFFIWYSPGTILCIVWMNQFRDFCTDWLFPYFLPVSLTEFFTYNTQILHLSYLNKTNCMDIVWFRCRSGRRPRPRRSTWRWTWRRWGTERTPTWRPGRRRRRRIRCSPLPPSLLSGRSAQRTLSPLGRPATPSARKERWKHFLPSVRCTLRNPSASKEEWKHFLPLLRCETH